MNRCMRLTAFLLSVAITVLLLTASLEPDGLTEAGTAHSQFVLVSLPALHVGAAERIVGFHLKVTSGRIAQMADMPIGWSVSVENDPSWNTKIDASILVAAAAVDTSFFKNFAVIEKERSAENPFNLVGEVDVSADFSKVRKIPVAMKNFVVRESPQPLRNRPSK